MGPRSEGSTNRGAALFGKLPRALDFVRIAQEYPESVRLERWLHAGHQRLAARGCAWPSGPVRFVLAPKEPGELALLGVASESRDRAGRRYPLVIYSRCAPLAARCGTPALLAASDRFCSGAEQVLSKLAELSLQELAFELHHLHAPQVGEVRTKEAQLEKVLTTRSCGDFIRPLFAAQDSAALQAGCQALWRLRSGRTAAGHALDGFECPVRGLLDGVIWTRWFELSQSRRASCLFQLGGDSARWLIAPGALPERAWLYWAVPVGKYPQRCILQSEHARAQAQEPAGIYAASLQRAFELLLCDKSQSRFR